MISPKIDLTENREFSGGHSSIMEMDTPIPDFMFYEKMTPEQMDKFLFREKYFGKFTHYNERYKIFDGERKWKEKVRTHCERCGKEIKAPWTKRFGLCPECDDIMENSGVPWKDRYKTTPNDESGWSNDRTAYDLFNAR